MILDDLKKFKKTFTNFNKFVFYNVCNNDKKKYSNFNKLPESTILFYILNFLENQKVPITEAISYYSYQYETNFKDSVKYMIKNEFYRIENNKKTNYIPF